MEPKKTRIMIILSVLVCVMAVGYAVLAQQLNIKGRASIDSTWRVEITKITEKDQLGGASSKEVPNYTATTANFNVGLVQPGDSISYEVEISNLGTLNAKVDSINVVMDENEAIKYTVSGVTEGDKLASGSKATMTVKVEYESSVTSQPSKVGKDITVTVNYVQDVAGGTDTPTYTAYSIGDQIEFSGSKWYVIKNSSTSDDYVTLLKEKVLTGNELGEYATYESIPYYNWGEDTCSSVDISGCSNDYDRSSVKSFLEGTYLPTLGEENLKAIDGYKIRLITREELSSNLGWDSSYSTLDLTDENQTVPIWVYKNFGNVYAYYTMSPNVDDNYQVWAVDNIGAISHANVRFYGVGTRPVINLLKTSIL